MTLTAASKPEQLCLHPDACECQSFTQVQKTTEEADGREHQHRQMTLLHTEKPEQQITKSSQKIL